MFAKIWNRRASWKRVTVTVLAVVLLPAVPVSALTFLSPWNITQSQSHGAPAAVTMPDFMGLGTLLVDMGATANRLAKSTVTATRDFSIAPGGETLNISHVFETLLRDASLKVKIKVSPRKGFNIPITSFNAGPAPQTFNFANLFSHFLPAGNYKIRVKITYKNYGEWDNSLPNPGSPHTFAVTSL